MVVTVGRTNMTAMLTRLFHGSVIVVTALLWTTSAFAIDPPTNLSPQGSVGAGSIVLCWTPPAGAASYGIRLQDNTDGTLRDARNNCSGNPLYLCIDFLGSSTISVTVYAGHSYTWWVHAIASSGAWSDAAGAGFVATGATSGTGTVNLTQSDHPFKGVGWNVQFDFYDWSNPDFLQMFDDAGIQFARAVWYIDTHHPHPQGNAVFESSLLQGLYAFMAHATQKNISVMLTNWDGGGKFDDYYSCLPGCAGAWPDSPFWLAEIVNTDPTNSQNRFCHPNFAGERSCDPSEKSGRQNVTGVESDHPRSDVDFATTLVSHLDYMVHQKGFRVDFLSLWNEPNGDWSYHPRNTSRHYPDSFSGLYQQVAAALSNHGLGQTRLVGMDESYNAAEDSQVKTHVDFAIMNWNSNVGAFSVHNYDGQIGPSAPVRYLYDRAGGRPVIVGEAGHKGPSGCEDGGFNPWGNSLETTRLMLSDIRMGAYAVARWWFNGGVPSQDCWTAVDSTTTPKSPIPATFNAIKILARSLPQAQSAAAVLSSNFDFSATGGNVEGVAINAAAPGAPPKLVLWFVNKGASAFTFTVTVNGVASGQTLSFASDILQGTGSYAITSGPSYSLSAGNPVLTLSLPPNAIFVVRQLYVGDGDNKFDPAVYRPGTADWFIRRSSDGGVTQINWGCTSCSDTPVPADYDGDGFSDVAVFRGTTGEWFIRRSSDGGLTQIGWGCVPCGDVPVPADYDHDGRADVAVYRQSTGQWFILRSSDGAVLQPYWGCVSCGDIPVPADYDGDGRADIAVYRPGTGEWFILRSSDGGMTYVGWGCGSCSDRPVPADYDGDGRADIAVYRQSTGQWFILRSSDGGVVQPYWGCVSCGDRPMPADYDGDGRADVAIYRPSTGEWYILRSSDGGYNVFGLGGASGDQSVKFRSK
jgi:hypothetical protein